MACSEVLFYNRSDFKAFKSLTPNPCNVDIVHIEPPVIYPLKVVS